MRFGRETRFSIFDILFSCKLRSLSFYSPSRSGKWSKSRLSRFKRSGFAYRSDGLRYTTNTPRICYNSAKIILSSSYTLFTIPCLRRYLYLSSYSDAASSKAMNYFFNDINQSNNYYFVHLFLRPRMLENL